MNDYYEHLISDNNDYIDELESRIESHQRYFTKVLELIESNRINEAAGYLKQVIEDDLST